MKDDKLKKNNGRFCCSVSNSNNDTESILP